MLDDDHVKCKSKGDKIKMNEKLKLSNYVLTKSNYPKDGYCLLFSTLTRAVVVLKSEFLELLSKGELKKIPSKYIESLFDQGMLMPSSENETQYVKYLFNKGQFSNESLGLMILTTYDCNLKCSYCIETDIQPFRKEYTNKDTVESIISWIQLKVEERHPKFIEVVFYGGEPLLNKNPIFQISNILHSDSPKKGVNYSFGIITNGTIDLSENEFKELTKNGMKFIQITIDGNKEINDHRRIYKNGKGTFNDIISNLKKFVEFVTVIVRVNIDKDNMKDIKNLMKSLEEKRLKEKIKLDFAPRMKSCLRNISCDKDVLDDKEFAHFIADDLLPFVKNKGFSVAERFVRNGPCLLMSESQFVIDPVGDIYKCAGFVGMSDFVVGNVKERKFNRRYVKFISRDNWLECIKCPYVPLCGGGCAFESYTKLGDYNKRVCKKELFSNITLGMLSNSLKKEKILNSLKAIKE